MLFSLQTIISPTVYTMEKLITKQKFIIFNHLNHFNCLKLVWWSMISKADFQICSLSRRLKKSLRRNLSLVNLLKRNSIAGIFQELCYNWNSTRFRNVKFKSIISNPPNIFLYKRVHNYPTNLLENIHAKAWTQ